MCFLEGRDRSTNIIISNVRHACVYGTCYFASINTTVIMETLVFDHDYNHIIIGQCVSIKLLP